MNKKRIEDRLPIVVALEGARPRAGSSLDPLFARTEDEAGDLPDVALVLWRNGEGPPVVVEGRVRSVSEEGVYDLPESLKEWQRETMRLRDRARMGERFIVFAEQIARADRPEEAYAALTDHAAELVGGYRAVVHLGAISEPAGAFMPILVRRDETETGGPFEDLAPHFKAAGAATAAVAPLDERTILLVLERRHERVYDPHDWYVLRAVARTAQAALERV